MTGPVAIGPRRTGGWPRIAIALLGVPVILLGLLAMHILVGTNLDAGNGSGVANAMSPATRTLDAQAIEQSFLALGAVDFGAAALPTPAQNCDGTCGPSRDMINMTCVVGLLVAIVLLTLQLVLSRWESLRPVLRVLAAKAAALAPPAPPSLHVLSISRT